jgi:hypothetical protein
VKRLHVLVVVGILAVLLGPWAVVGAEEHEGGGEGESEEAFVGPCPPTICLAPVPVAPPASGEPGSEGYTVPWETDGALCQPGTVFGWMMSQWGYCTEPVTSPSGEDYINPDDYGWTGPSPFTPEEHQTVYTGLDQLSAYLDADPRWSFQGSTLAGEFVMVGSFWNGPHGTDYRDYFAVGMVPESGFTVLASGVWGNEHRLYVGLTSTAVQIRDHTGAVRYQVGHARFAGEMASVHFWTNWSGIGLRITEGGGTTGSYTPDGRQSSSSGVWNVYTGDPGGTYPSAQGFLWVDPNPRNFTSPWHDWGTIFYLAGGVVADEVALPTDGWEDLWPDKKEGLKAAIQVARDLWTSIQTEMDPAPTTDTLPDVPDIAHDPQVESDWVLGDRIGVFIGWMGEVMWDSSAWLLGGIRGAIEWLGGELWGAITWLGDLLSPLLELVVGLLEVIRDEIIRGFQAIFGALTAVIQFLGSLVALVGQVLAAVIGGFALVAQLLGHLVSVVPSVLYNIMLAVQSIPGLLWNIGAAILALPGLLADLLFTPSLELDLSWDPPEGSNPIITDLMTEVGAIPGVVANAVDTTGSCGPSLTVTRPEGEFSWFAPAPASAGCAQSGENIGLTGVGDLFGFRLPLRTLMVAALVLGIIRQVIATLPGGERSKALEPGGMY